MRVLYCTTYTDRLFVFLAIIFLTYGGLYTEEFVIKSCLGPGTDISLPGQYIYHPFTYLIIDLNEMPVCPQLYRHKTDKWRWERPGAAGSNRQREDKNRRIIAGQSYIYVSRIIVQEETRNPIWLSASIYTDDGLEYSKNVQALIFCCCCRSTMALVIIRFLLL